MRGWKDEMNSHIETIKNQNIRNDQIVKFSTAMIIIAARNIKKAVVK